MRRDSPRNQRTKKSNGTILNVAPDPTQSEFCAVCHIFFGSQEAETSSTTRSYILAAADGFLADLTERWLTHPERC